MNRKHVAILIVALLTIGIIQGGLHFRRQVQALKAEVRRAEATATTDAAAAQAERLVFEQLKTSTAGTIRFLDQWQPVFGATSSADAGEVRLASLIRNSGVISLSQRFETAGSTSPGVPQVMRAQITVEDDYAKAMNWLGEIEKDLPSSRVMDLKIAHGETGNDIRMDVVVDLPLIKPES